MARPALILAVAGAAVAAAGWLAWREWAERREIALGRDVYARACAACHGAELEGQPDWQTPLPNGRMPAPPHDASGHTWHHSDDVLLAITRKGMGAYVGNYESDMPGFESVLSEAEIAAVLAFIKSRWPERENDYQQAQNAAQH